MNELSRFKPLDHLPLSPGVCFICSGGVGPFIDTSRQLEFEGAIYVCIGCVKEMFSQLGLHSIVNEEEVEQLIAQARAEGIEQGELAMMGKFSEFVTSYSDRSDIPGAGVPGEPDGNSLETPSGAKADDPKPAPSLIEGDGLISFQELGELSGNPGNGESLFNL